MTPAQITLLVTLVRREREKLRSEMLDLFRDDYHAPLTAQSYAVACSTADALLDMARAAGMSTGDLFELDNE